MTILKSRIEGDRFQRSLSLIETCWLPNTGFDWYEMSSPELGVGLGVSGCLDGRSEGQLGNVCLRKVLISSCHSLGGRKGSIPGARVIPCLLYSISSLQLAPMTRILSVWDLRSCLSCGSLGLWCSSSLWVPGLHRDSSSLGTPPVIHRRWNTLSLNGFGQITLKIYNTINPTFCLNPTLRMFEDYFEICLRTKIRRTEVVMLDQDQWTDWHTMQKIYITSLLQNQKSFNIIHLDGLQYPPSFLW